MNFIGIVNGKGKVLFFYRITTVDTKQVYFLFTRLNPSARKTQVRSV